MTKNNRLKSTLERLRQFISERRPRPAEGRQETEPSTASETMNNPPKSDLSESAIAKTTDPQHKSEQPNSRASARATFLLGGLGLVLLGQYLIRVSMHNSISAIVIAIGGMSFLLGVIPTEETRIMMVIWSWFERLAGYLKISLTQLPLIPFGLTLSLASRAAAGNSPQAHSPWHGVIWLAGIALVVIGCWRKEARDEAHQFDWIDWVIVLTLVVASLAIRWLFLEDIPYAMSGDEGSGGLMAWDFALGLRNNTLITGWASYPATYFWIVSVFQNVLGRTVEAIRLPSAIGGALAVLALYWAVRQMFDRSLAFLSALFLTAFHFHVLFSRIAVAIVWDGVFLATMIGALWVSWQRNKRWAFILAGVMIGIGQYFYSTGHLLPIYALLWLILLYLWSRKKGRFPGIICIGLVTLAVVLPLALYYATHVAELMAPLVRVSLLKPDWIQYTSETTGVSPVGIFAQQFWLTFSGFTIRPIIGVYGPASPMLLTIPATLFLAGLLISFFRIKDPRYTILLLGLLGPIMAGTLSVSAPNASRLLLTTPMVAILVILPIIEIKGQLEGAWPKLSRLLGVAMLALVVVIGILDLRFFFCEAMPQGWYSDSKAQLAREIGEYINDQGEDIQVYYFGVPRMGYKTIPSLPYLTENATGHDMILPFDSDWNPPIEGDRILFIVLPEHEQALQEIDQRYGEGITITQSDEQGQPLFYAREIKP